MAVLIFLITVLDAAILPTTGLLPAVVLVIVVEVGVWRVTNYRRWYILALVYMILATLLYLVGSAQIDEKVVHKLADWAFVFLILGSVQLARYWRTHHG